MAARSIATGETNLGRRTISFEVYNTDGTAKTDLAAAAVQVYQVGVGVITAFAAQFYHTFGAHYEVQPTIAEITLPPGTQLLVGPLDASGYVVVAAPVQIGIPTMYSTTLPGVDVQSQNGHPVIGTGVSGDLWRGA